jgi:hypothetical protein
MKSWPLSRWIVVLIVAVPLAWAGSCFWLESDWSHAALGMPKAIDAVEAVRAEP